MHSLMVIAFVCISNLHVLPAQSFDSLFKHVDANDKDGSYFEIIRDDYNKINRFLKKDNKQRLAMKSPNEKHRLKTSLNVQKPVNIYPPADLCDGNFHLIIHWAGQNSGVIAVLTRNVSSTSSVSSSNVYFSYDYGKTYLRKLQSSNQGGPSSYTNPDKSHPSNALIDMFYSSKVDINRYIFTSINSSSIYTTTDAGRTITKHGNLPFVPDAISMHPTKPWIVLAHDKTSSDKPLYKSDDFGHKWTKIQSDVKDFEWGYSGDSNFDHEDILYVQRIEPGIDETVSVLRTATYFVRDIHLEVLITNVESFVIVNNTLFATRKAFSGSGVDLWIAKTPQSRFVKANFRSGKKLSFVHVVDVADAQIMVRVRFDPGESYLYISEPNGVDFTLSLRNIVEYRPDLMFYRHSKDTGVDIHKVNGLRSVFIANTLTNASYVFSRRVSYITFNKGSTWEKLPAPTYDANGDRVNCSARRNCSLHLSVSGNDLLPPNASPMLSQPSAPGFVLAQGNIGEGLNYREHVYFSSTGGRDWTQEQKAGQFVCYVLGGGIPPWPGEGLWVTTATKTICFGYVQKMLIDISDC